MTGRGVGSRGEFSRNLDIKVGGNRAGRRRIGWPGSGEGWEGRKTERHAFQFGCEIGNWRGRSRTSFEEREKKIEREIRTKVVSHRVGCSISLLETEEVFEMLAASFCREVHFTVLSSTTMASRVPRCLFGKPNSRETVEMLHEALDAERSKFAKRWGVDPRSEDKENNYQKKYHDKYEQSPKKRSNPYSRQTSIHGERIFLFFLPPVIFFVPE